MPEVQHHVSDGLEVVPATLLDAQVSIEGSIASCACKILVLLVGDVLHGFGVPVLLAEPEVDDVHEMRILLQPHQEILRFNVPVDVVMVVQLLNSLDLHKDNATIWSAIMRVVLSEKDLPQISNRSSREGPNMSITSRLYLF